MAGGVFLLFKATTELHERLEGSRHQSAGPSMRAGFWAIILQIIAPARALKTTYPSMV